MLRLLTESRARRLSLLVGWALQGSVTVLRSFEGLDISCGALAMPKTVGVDLCCFLDAVEAERERRTPHRVYIRWLAERVFTRLCVSQSCLSDSVMIGSRM